MPLSRWNPRKEKAQKKFLSRRTREGQNLLKIVSFTVISHFNLKTIEKKFIKKLKTRHLESVYGDDISPKKLS